MFFFNIPVRMGNCSSEQFDYGEVREFEEPRFAYDTSEVFEEVYEFDFMKLSMYLDYHFDYCVINNSSVPTSFVLFLKISYNQVREKHR